MEKKVMMGAVCVTAVTFSKSVVTECLTFQYSLCFSPVCCHTTALSLEMLVRLGILYHGSSFVMILKNLLL